MALNRIQAIGNVGRDPEFKSLNSGDRVCNFSIAVTEKWTDKQSGEKKEKTEWINVVVWTPALIGVVEKYVKKGSKLYVEGKFQTRKYDKDGVTHYNTELVIQGFGGSIQLLGDPKDDGTQKHDASGRDYSQKDTQSQSRASYSADLDDEIPF